MNIKITTASESHLYNRIQDAYKLQSNPFIKGNLDTVGITQKLECFFALYFQLQLEHKFYSMLHVTLFQLLHISLNGSKLYRSHLRWSQGHATLFLSLLLQSLCNNFRRKSIIMIYITGYMMNCLILYYNALKEQEPMSGCNCPIVKTQQQDAIKLVHVMDEKSFYCRTWNTSWLFLFHQSKLLGK